MGQPGAKDTGGWTVILRRRNTTDGLVDFNRTWSEYRTGFGDPGEGEWWFGLSHLHALTYRQPYEVDLLLRDIEKGTFHAQYSSFRVEDEAHNYKLILAGFSGNLTHDALTSKHHGSPFSTWDKDNDSWGSGNCGKSNGGGWWFNNCHFTTLTAPFPTSADRNARTIRWLEDDWLVLDDVTLKIRPFNYAERFNVHNSG
ncbi:fibrinogen-like protein 1 [Portunus trituberculatus]|uniref:fibrinogen-like protein 1 n=1 Tax=Portunus trituberculatus TaxID=210409 RepID=UPI001E1CE76B|nr:fibrinogen-like protein 1 [Portunus trituberculatus]